MFMLMVNLTNFQDLRSLRKYYKLCLFFCLEYELAEHELEKVP